MFLACVKDVTVSFRGAAVTGAGFNLISDFEAMSVVSNRSVCCEAMDHLGGEGQGVSGGFEPSTPPLRWDGFMRLALACTEGIKSFGRRKSRNGRTGCPSL